MWTRTGLIWTSDIPIFAKSTEEIVAQLKEIFPNGEDFKRGHKFSGGERFFSGWSEPFCLDPLKDSKMIKMLSFENPDGTLAFIGSGDYKAKTFKIPTSDIASNTRPLLKWLLAHCYSLAASISEKDNFYQEDTKVTHTRGLFIDFFAFSWVAGDHSEKFAFHAGPAFEKYLPTRETKYTEVLVRGFLDILFKTEGLIPGVDVNLYSDSDHTHYITYNELIPNEKAAKKLLKTIFKSYGFKEIK